VILKKLRWKEGEIWEIGRRKVGRGWGNLNIF
jgi:hypothetical protein